jgi:virulence factor Mce-like protein
MRRSTGYIVANPVLVGAVTTLVVVVAVFLAYNANQGLPFVPTTQLKFQVDNGANLIPGNDVREGGSRLGQVTDMIPTRLPDGTVGAEVTMELDQDKGEIPVDSTINLRPRSVLGLKYVEITRGRSDETFGDGDVMPADQVTYPVEIADWEDMYDEPTRTAIQGNLEGFGNAYSQRGMSLNQTIATLPRLLRHLEPVMDTLNDEDTQLARFFRELGDVTRVLSPLAETYAQNFTLGANVFEAWSRFPDRLGETIDNAAPTFRTGIRSFRVQRPFLRDLSAMSVSLRRATDAIPGNVPALTGALRTGIPVVRRAPEMNENVRRTLNALNELMRDPGTAYALRGLTRTVGILNPLVRFVGPYITVCNYWNYAWTNAGEHLTEPDRTGGSQRTLLNQASRPADPTAPNIGAIGARRPVNGEPTVSGVPMNLHLNLYSAAVSREGEADCESGQRGYLTKLTAYNDDPRLQIVTDPRIPGNQGPTFTGRPRVPEGQTFSRNPELGPVFPPRQDRP